MTQINQQLRDNLKDIENYIITVLREQPHSDAECEMYLYQALHQIRVKARIAYESYVNTRSEVIKQKCQELNDESKQNNNI